MATNDQARGTARQPMKRRDFLKRTGWGSVGATGLIAGMGRSRASAHSPSPYAAWHAASNKPPKRGGILTRASAWDPPVLDPRLTNSVGLFQIATLTYNRLLRYPFADEAKNNADLTLKGDLAETWEGSAGFSGLDLQAAPGREMAERAAAQRAGAGRRRRQVLLRGICQGGRAVVHVPGNRGDDDA